MKISTKVYVALRKIIILTRHENGFKTFNLIDQKLIFHIAISNSDLITIVFEHHKNGTTL